MSYKICAACNKEGVNGDGFCRLCGAQRQINNDTGCVIWVRNGRVVVADDDMRAMYIRDKVPIEEWPEKLRGGK